MCSAVAPPENCETEFPGIQLTPRARESTGVPRFEPGKGLGCRRRNGPRGSESGGLAWRVGRGPARGEGFRGVPGVQNLPKPGPHEFVMSGKNPIETLMVNILFDFIEKIYFAAAFALVSNL